jgi:putative lipoprotein
MPGRERHRLGSTTFAGLVAFVVAVAGARPAHAEDPDPWFGRDKALHFGVTTLLSAETYVIVVNRTPAHARWQGLAIGAGITLAVGAAKEGWDALGHGDPSWRDFTWDAIGTACGLGLAWGVDLLVRGVDEEHPLFRAPELRF